MEICDDLLDLLGRPSPLPSGRSLWDTTDLSDLPADEWRLLARSDGSGSGICRDIDGRKYLISRVGQKNLTKVTWQTGMIHSNLDISQCQVHSPARRQDLLASGPEWPKPWSLDDCCCRVRDPKGSF